MLLFLRRDSLLLLLLRDVCVGSLAASGSREKEQCKLLAQVRETDLSQAAEWKD